MNPTTRNNIPRFNNGNRQDRRFDRPALAAQQPIVKKEKPVKPILESTLANRESKTHTEPDLAACRRAVDGAKVWLESARIPGTQANRSVLQSATVAVWIAGADVGERGEPIIFTHPQSPVYTTTDGNGDKQLVFSPADPMRAVTEALAFVADVSAYVAWAKGVFVSIMKKTPMPDRPVFTSGYAIMHADEVLQLLIPWVGAIYEERWLESFAVAATQTTKAIEAAPIIATPPAEIPATEPAKGGLGLSTGEMIAALQEGTASVTEILGLEKMVKDSAPADAVVEAPAAEEAPVSDMEKLQKEIDELRVQVKAHRTAAHQAITREREFKPGPEKKAAKKHADSCNKAYGQLKQTLASKEKAHKELSERALLSATASA